MNQFVIGALYNFDFNDNFKFQHDPSSITIIKDSAHIAELINDQYFIASIGSIEHSKLLQNKLHFSVNRFEKEDLDHDALFLIALQKYLTQTFLTSLWLVKDNAVNTDNFIWWDLESGRIVMDSPKIIFSSSTGEYINTYFSEEEIIQAAKWHELVIKYSSTEKTEDTTNPSIGLKISGFNNFNKRNTSFDDDRIRRSFKLALIARSQSFLPAKIASYISAIEALISSNKESLVMQVSERVPKIIGGSTEDKLIIHDRLREAYSVRSKYVHGDKVSGKKIITLDQISKGLDEILRSLLLKIVNEHEEIKDYNETSMTNWYKRNFMF